MSTFGKLLCALGALLLAACAPQANLPQMDAALVSDEVKTQRIMVLRDSVDTLDRLNRVSWNLLAQNAELCGDKVVKAVGLTFLELDDYPEEKREIMKEVLGVSWRPTVFQAPPGSPAQLAGIRRGDIAIQIANTKVENKKQARETLKEALKKGGDVPVEVERDGQRMPLVLRPMALCNYPVLLDNSLDLNAYADGGRIIVLKGMMRFVRSDDELAAIVGHELAHNTQLHIRDKNVNSMLGQFLVDLPLTVLLGVNPGVGQQVGRHLYSQEYEFEADYVGLYFTARAGYDIHNVPGIWRRMSLDNPGAITMGTTHPSNSKRFVALEAAAKEIDDKRTAGMALRPELKKAPAPAMKAPPKDLAAEVSEDLP